MTKKEFISKLKSNRGDIGIKQIAITVGIILIIGAAVSMIKGTFLNTWITWIWDTLTKYITDNVK